MTAKDLTKLGFQIRHGEDSGTPFHYYALGEFITNDNIEALDKGWIASFYGEIYDYHIDNLEDLTTLLNVMKKYQVESGFDINSLGG